ncbi:hypothetical protein G6F43_002786 [Rhizopus delemar]|nr:hypothetical protein G6F43_002786 [Rhizopus delemar]
MQATGIDATVFGPHSIRSAFSTKAVQMGHTIDDVKTMHIGICHKDIISSIFPGSENNTTSEVEMEATKVGIGTTYNRTVA